MAAKTSSAVKNKWNKENYDRIELVIPKGDKEKIKVAADASGESVNGYIKTATKQRMEREGFLPKSEANDNGD